MTDSSLESLEKDMVSIVMPTYQQADYLQQALASVMSQSYPNWELILIDNFSTDNTEQVASQFFDSRIRYYKFRNNGVIASSRNLGINLARGEYVAFLDSDDTWEPAKLERSIQILKTGVDLVCHNMTLFDNKEFSRVLIPQRSDVSAKPFENLIQKGNFICTSTVVVKKTALGLGFDTSKDIVTAEDFDLWLNIFSNNSRVCSYLPESMTNYRIHDANNSSKIEQHAYAVRKVMQKWVDLSGVDSKWTTFQEAATWYSAGKKMSNQGQKRLASKYFVKSLFLRPSSLKVWLAFLMNFLPNSLSALIQDFLISRFYPRAVLRTSSNNSN